MRRIILSMAAIGALAGAGASTASGQQLSVYGQLRPRTELRTTPLRTDGFTAMRARVGMRGSIAPAARAVVEFQDVRMWGDELNTMSNPDRIEMHQGYLELGHPEKFAGRIGRQEVSYGDERLIGAADWTTQGRAFDGARAMLQRGRTSADIFFYQIGDAADPAVKLSEQFAGVYATQRAFDMAQLELYVMQNRLHATADTRQTTAGTRISGTHGFFSYRIEAASQRGTRASADLDAYLATGRATVTLPGRSTDVTLWYDYLSGDNDPADGTIHTFETLFGTNHKFYGTADIFTNIPLHTGGRGLQDMALKVGVRASARVNAGADMHMFRVANGDGLASTDLGRELDTSVTVRLAPKLMLNGGASWYGAGDAMPLINRPIGNQTFTFLMLNATF
jgi:hypothetical protein